MDCKEQYEITQNAYECWKRSFRGGYTYDQQMQLAEIYESEKSKLFEEFNCDFIAGKEYSDEYIFSSTKKKGVLKNENDTSRIIY